MKEQKNEMKGLQTMKGDMAKTLYDVVNTNEFKDSGMGCVMFLNLERNFGDLIPPYETSHDGWKCGERYGDHVAITNPNGTWLDDKGNPVTVPVNIGPVKAANIIRRLLDVIKPVELVETAAKGLLETPAIPRRRKRKTDIKK